MTEIASIIDHTFLKSDGKASDIAKLCREAKEYGFASVCVHPCEVARCARLLEGSDVKVCTVVGFPLGQNKWSVKLYEALGAMEDGAEELDFVMNVKDFKDARTRAAEANAWRETLDFCRHLDSGVVAKLIIECCLLTDEEKVLAAKAAVAAGFNFVKTSTGFSKGGATEHDVRLIRQAVGRKTGVKASGGIRTYEDAVKMVKAGATRLGCSAGVEIVHGAPAI